MNRRIIVGIIAIATLQIGCSEEKTQEQRTHSVMTVQPQQTGTMSEKTLPGTIEAAREISFGFKTPGQIAKISVKEGDYVKAGQLLATLDDKDIRLDVEATQIQHDQLKREVERLEKLRASNSISGNDYDKAKSGLAQVEISLKASKNRLEYTHLYAPADGYVQSVQFEASEMVNAGTPVITLMDTKQMEVVCNIPASLYMERESMQSYSCRGRFSDGQWQTLRLLSISPTADANQLYKMRFSMSGNASQRMGGQNVTVRIGMSAEGSSTGLTVPIASVLNEAGKSYVMVLNEADSTVSRKEVEVGAMAGNGTLTVLSGLKGNEQIVKAGASRLTDGERVRVIGKGTETNIGNQL